MSAPSQLLIVDDIPENIDVFAAILSDDYQLKIALNGENALRIARCQPHPDLIILDIMMPGMDGYAVCRKLKSDPVTRHIPVIFVTAMDDTHDEEKGFAVGASDYITKPISPPIVLSRVRAQIALSREQQRLHGLVQKKDMQLEVAYEKIKKGAMETILRLTHAAEYKDENTGEHIQRMSQYAAVIGRELGLREKTVETLLYAAPMHDIGKIGIPDRILLKPGKLDADEWQIMKQHPIIGSKILSGSRASYIRLGEVIARGHHEKWDGSGYPQGLSGKQIPLACRIVSLADVFDALTSKRPYKKPFSIEKSLNIIAEKRGSHFDPDVVDAFMKRLDEILAIKAAYKDKA
ncbi:MAG: two-component system response regulator [Deltaproteobacteria bacterium]|nr:MAG: two-component system response regulator [Deltaproteobacteria bacterium]